MPHAPEPRPLSDLIVDPCPANAGSLAYLLAACGHAPWTVRTARAGHPRLEQRAAAAGFDHYFLKAGDPDQLGLAIGGSTPGGTPCTSL